AWFTSRGIQTELTLAVKLFGLEDEESRRMFTHEAALFERCARIGVKAPKIFGLAQINSKLGALLTIYEPGLTTLDNIPWDVLSTEDQDYHLNTAVAALTSLHEQGIFHGDAEFKNLAFTEEQGETIAVDL